MTGSGKSTQSSIDEMSNLSKKLREELHGVYQIPKVIIDHSQFSNDGTIKSHLREYEEQPLYRRGALSRPKTG